MTRNKWIFTIVLAILTVAFFAFYLINNNQNNSRQWQNSHPVPTNWKLLAENEGGGDLVDSPQRTVTKTYETQQDITTALQEFETLLTRANYSDTAIDTTGCTSINPTPSCYATGTNETATIKASKSALDQKYIVVVITER